MKRKINQFLKAGYSLATMEHMLRDGTVNQTQFEAYCAVWDWMAFRFTGRAGMKQDSFWKHYGQEAFYRRINRVRSAFGFAAITPPVSA